MEDTLLAIERGIMEIALSVSPRQEVDGAILSLENILQRLYHLYPLLQHHSEHFTSATNNVNKMIEQLKLIEEDRLRHVSQRGRPEIPITSQEVSDLLQMDFTQVEIAQLLGCSTRTIRRRIVKFGLEQLVDFDHISDDDLDGIVENFVVSFPSAGQTTLEGHLRSEGLRIQRQRIRDSLLRVDPWGVEERSRHVLQ